MLAHLRAVPAGRVLEIGCGAGSLLADLQALGHECTAVETSVEARRLAARMLADAPACAMAPVGDVAALAATIARALGRIGELRAMRPALSAFARARYAPERQAQRYRALYEEFLGRA